MGSDPPDGADGGRVRYLLRHPSARARREQQAGAATAITARSISGCARPPEPPTWRMPPAAGQDPAVADVGESVRKSSRSSCPGGCLSVVARRDDAEETDKRAVRDDTEDDHGPASLRHGPQIPLPSRGGVAHPLRPMGGDASQNEPNESIRMTNAKAPPHDGVARGARGACDVATTSARN